MDPLQQILQWLGHYWWLAFPLMGVAGGAARAWEQSARRRHERRLETLRLKAEIKTAQLAARGQTPRPAGILHRSSPDPAPSAELLQRLFTEHDEITARWLDYELDVAKVIAFPAMSDGREPLTAAFLRAKKIADALRPSSADAKVTEQQVTEYLDAVGNYAVAFEVAEKDARRLRDSRFTEGERKRLERAQHMLKVAVDESATPAERQTAYRRVREELDGLIDLSDAAVHNLEKKIALQLSPGAAPASGAASSGPAQAAAASPSASASPAQATAPSGASTQTDLDPAPQADPIPRTAPRPDPLPRTEG